MNFLKQNSKKLILLALIVVIGLFSVQYMDSSQDATGALKWKSTKKLTQASIAKNITPNQSTLQKGLNRIKFKLNKPLKKDTKLSVIIDSNNINFAYDKKIKTRRNDTSFSYDFKISESTYNSINQNIVVKIITNDNNSLVFLNQTKSIKFTFVKPEQSPEEQEETPMPQIAPQNNESSRNDENQEPQEIIINTTNINLQAAPTESTNQEPQEQSNENSQEQAQDSNTPMNYQLQAAPTESTNQEPQEQSNENSQEQAEPTPQYNPDQQYPMPEEQTQDNEDQEPQEVIINITNNELPDDLTEEELEKLLEELE